MEPPKDGEASGFDWDDGNRAKCVQHGVSLDEIEFVLRHAELRTRRDSGHSDQEERIQSFARNAEGRPVFVVFTMRAHSGRLLVRPISARYMHGREVDGYEEDVARSQDG